MDRSKNTLLVDVAVGLLAGLMATKAYELAQETLQRQMPEHVKQREERLQPEPSSRVAARKIAQRFGYRLDGRRLDLATMMVHYGVGMAWGPLHGFMRRHARMSPLGAGFVTGAAMSLIMDEALVPALGFCPPNREFPAATHIRGCVNHLVYGAAVALTAEFLYRLTYTTPGSCRTSRA